MHTEGTIRDIVAQKSSQIWTIAPDALVIEAIQVMAENRVGALPVLHGNTLVGIITERDYLQKVALRGRSSRTSKVSEIMTTVVRTARPTDSIREVMERMTAFHTRHLPVMNGSKLTAIVSIGDLVKWVISQQEATIDQMNLYIANVYPG